MLIPKDGKAHWEAVLQIQAIRLKICDSHLTGKVANKCRNVWRGMKSVSPLPLPSYELLVTVKGNLGRKKFTENLDFVQISSFIRGSTETSFCGCSTETLWKKPLAES